MSALTANKTGLTLEKRSDQDSVTQWATADEFYLNSLIGIKDGVVAPLGAQSGPNTRFYGICIKQESTAASGAERIGVDVSGRKIINHAVTGASAATDVGATVYCSTDNTADMTLTEAATAYPIGRVSRWYSATLCDVLLFSDAESQARLYRQEGNVRKYGLTAETAAATISLADIKSGLVTITHATGGTVALTVDTGTLMDASDVPIGYAYEWTLINLSGTPATNTATLTAATGHTLVGDVIVGSATNGLNSRRFITKKTAAATWITYTS